MEKLYSIPIPILFWGGSSSFRFITTDNKNIILCSAAEKMHGVLTLKKFRHEIMGGGGGPGGVIFSSSLRYYYSNF